MAPTTPIRVSRVATTSDDDRADVLAASLRALGLTPVACPVLIETPPADPTMLAEAARSLDGRAWVIVASVRAVRALTAARGRPWPAGVRTAAVGPATAQALRDAGVTTPVLTAPTAGAEALWDALSGLSWRGCDALVPTTPGGRTLLADRLRAAGAAVDEVEAYRMEPRPGLAIARDWTAATPEAVVLASAGAAGALVAAIGAEALGAVRVVAIGATTAAALAAAGVRCESPAQASFEAAARLLSAPAVPTV